MAIEILLGSVFAFVSFCAFRGSARGAAALLPLGVFAGTWALALWSYAALRLAYPELGAPTIAFLLGSIVAGIAGSTFAYIAARGRGSVVRDEATSMLPVSPVPVATLSLVGAAVSGYLSIQLFAGGDYGLPFTDAAAMRTARFLRSAEGLPPLMSLAELAYYSGLSALATSVYARRKIRVVASLTGIAGVIMMLTTASRAPLILLLISGAFALLLRGDLAAALRVLRRPRFLAAIALIWLAGTSIIASRDEGVAITFQAINFKCGECLPDSLLSQGLLSNAVYGASSMSNLDDFMASVHSSNLEDGRLNFVSGLISPAARFGFDIETKEAILPAGPTNTAIFQNRARYNTYSGFRDLVLDFGKLGALAVFGFLTAFAGLVCSRQRQSPVSLTLATFLLAWMAASPFVNAFGDLGKSLLGALAGAVLQHVISGISRPRGAGAELGRERPARLRF